MILCVLQCLWGMACIVLLNLRYLGVLRSCPVLSVILGSASVQVVIDFAMVLLPQRIIWSLHMNWKRKLGVSIIFAVGLM